MGNEGIKFDFKREADLSKRGKRDKVELAQLVIAIANSDADDLDDTGYIILGAERGKIVGGLPELSDSTCAALIRALNNYVSPPARIEVKGFCDSAVGWFGAIIVHPSTMRRPHFVAKEYTSPDGKLHIRKNECYVRDGENIVLAGRDDFDRMYAQIYEPQIRAAEGRRDPQPAPLLRWLNRGEATDSIVLPPAPSIESFEVDEVEEEPVGAEEVAEFLGKDPSEATEYNEKLKRYRAAVAEHAPEIRRHRRSENNLNALVVRCDVHGEAPLLNYQVELFFPSAFELFDKSRPPKPPPLPEKPSWPHFGPVNRVGTMLDRIAAGPPHLDFGPLLSHRAPPTWGGLDVEDRRVSGWCDKTKHGFGMDFSPVFVVPPEEEDIYEVRWKVSAENLRAPVEGVLKIRVVQGAKPALAPMPGEH